MPAVITGPAGSRRRPQRLPLLLAALAVLAPASARAEEWKFTQGEWTLTVSSEGDLLSLADRSGRELVRRETGDALIRIGLVPPGRAPSEVDLDALLACRRPVKADQAIDGAVFDYTLAPQLPFRLHYEIHFRSAAGMPLVKRTVVVTPDAPPFAGNLLVVAGNPIVHLDPARRVFAPSRDGIGEEVLNAHDRQWLWGLNGAGRTGRGPAERLALPMLSESTSGSALRVTQIADPSFTTSFRLAHLPSGRPGEFSWVYTGAQAPMQESEMRILWTVVHTGAADEALRAWSATALADVPPGPSWIHDVALCHVDALSRDGQGWFEEIEALERLIPRSDRAKAVVILHGWYDLVGRYTFDETAGRLDDAWTAFAAAAPVGAADARRPVQMSKAEVRRRLAHARDRGFRVGLAFAEGLVACEGVKELALPDLMLSGTNRTGPDQVGKAYVLNPLHARVQGRYLAYLKALLAEYGPAIDVLVWFDTSDVREGATGAGAARGYAARAMMRLVRDLAREAARNRPDLAFFVGDALGPALEGTAPRADAPPYALVAHGCCAAGAYRPDAIPYGLIPTLRNALWPVPRPGPAPLDALRFAVEHYGVPVGTSSGWPDSRGPSRMEESERRALADLFQARAARRRQVPWLAEPGLAFPSPPEPARRPPAPGPTKK
jgi:hypothetical protein